MFLLFQVGIFGFHASFQGYKLSSVQHFRFFAVSATRLWPANGIAAFDVETKAQCLPSGRSWEVLPTHENSATGKTRKQIKTKLEEKKKVIGKAWKLWLGLITGGQLSDRFCTASGLTSSIKVMWYRRPMAPTLTSQEAQKTAALVQRSKLRTLQYAKK